MPVRIKVHLLCWVIHMCHHLDILFPSSDDWTRYIFGRYFLSSTDTKWSFWVPILSELDLFGPKFHFWLDLFESNFQQPVAHTHRFSDRVPPSREQTAIRAVQGDCQWSLNNGGCKFPAVTWAQNAMPPKRCQPIFRPANHKRLMPASGSPCLIPHWQS